MTPGVRTAAVLSGGGAYGAFAVGVLKALGAGQSPATSYRRLEPDIFTGTSVGAFNAAVMVSHFDEGTLSAAGILERIWLDRVSSRPGSCGNGVFRIRGNIFDFADPACLDSPVSAVGRAVEDGVRIGAYLLSRGANFAADSGSTENRAVQLFDIASFIDASRFSTLLEDVISSDRIASSAARLQIVATNWITGEAQYFDNAAFRSALGVQALMASTAIPALFPAVRIGRDIYVDGGVVENTPLKPAIQLGATEIHVIYLDPEPRFIPRSGQASTVDSMMRTYYMMMATMISEDIASARWINEGLAAIARIRQSGGASRDDAEQAVRVAAQVLDQSGDPPRMLEIHRYFPTKSIGGNLGFLNFERDQLARLIREGEYVALTHDCAESGCLKDSNA